MIDLDLIKVSCTLCELIKQGINGGLSIRVEDDMSDLNALFNLHNELDGPLCQVGKTHQQHD